MDISLWVKCWQENYSSPDLGIHMYDHEAQVFVSSRNANASPPPPPNDNFQKCEL